ncbi:Coiled-coil domain-containing protein 89 [Bagarius yarrelli]|uniref:Coiled-coil domain-containing protein 89 n=1 Tax=Bagarius yarrelli TaxID=175774 RepID=A0A556TW88_BAGYA|nr:Coiled-coil domain-containing protein 89 [Bagarius yarrelli]
MIAAFKDMDDVHQALEKLRGLSQEERTEAGMLRSRLDEQSSLICMLKQRADEMLLRCQTLEQVNTELQKLQVTMQRELNEEREKSAKLEQRFMHLAANHRQMINFKDEYKQKNAELMKENKRLREENEKLFSKKVQEKKEIIHKLSKELSDLNEKYRHSENEYQFEIEAAVVNADLRVKQLQHELHKADQTYADLNKEFEAYKKYSNDLLTKEKDLNARLRHVIS